MNDEFNKCFFKQLFVNSKLGNGDVGNGTCSSSLMNLKRVASNRVYYSSINLLTVDELDHDCELTLFFIRNNVHYNLKSDLDFDEYFEKCNYLFFNEGYILKKYNLNNCPLV